MKFELQPFHRNVPDKDLFEDLRRVAKVLDKQSVTMSEYDKDGKYHPSTLVRRFGSWFAALEKAGLQRTRELGVSEEEYFHNIERLWRLLGRQPRYSEVCKPLSKYCAGAYARRFGGWRNALEAFINFVNKEAKESDLNSDKMLCQADIRQNDKIVHHKTSRTPSWRLRFLVMRRDNFRCQHCGRSPASEVGVRLHIDHINPWSKGGETIMDNLKTLCKRCNIGKSDLPIDPTTD